MPLSSLLFWFCLSSSSWLFLLPFCSACVSPRHVSFFLNCLLSSLHSTEPRLKMSFLPPLLASPKRSFCGARALAWEPLLCASCSFLFFLLLSFSLVFLFPEYPSNISPLPATGSSVPLCPSTRHQWDSWFFFSLPVSCSCIPAHLHSLCLLEMGKWENWFFHLLCINLLEKTPLPITVEWKKDSWAGSPLLPLGIHSLLSFSLIRTKLCWSNQE